MATVPTDPSLPLSCPWLPEKGSQRKGHPRTLKRRGPSSYKGQDMFNQHKVEIEWGGRPLILETGKIARQADGAVLATYGETKVLATVVSMKEPKPGLDFFPLTVNYQEKTYAAGKIPGGYFKREGRPSEKETLVSRLIDRPIRPLFADGYKNDTQIVVTVVQHDLENDPDILSIVATSAALTLSGVPFMGPVGGARVGYINGEYVLNPHIDEMQESKLDLVVAGTADAVLMVESEAKELGEELMLGAVMFGHKGFQPVIDAIIKLAEVAAKEPRDFTAPDYSALEAEMLKIVGDELREAYKITDKQQRYAAVDAVKAKVKTAFAPAEGEEPKYTSEQIGSVFKELQAKVVRWNILDTGSRIDGRDLKTVRKIVSEVGVLPRTHGSALFTRGETQALVVATLGTGEDEQYVDSLTGMYKEKFLLHYNFLPIPSVRPAAWVRRAAAKSATASSPGGPSGRCCRALTSSPTRCASSRRSPSPTARPRWPPSAAPRWR